MAGSRHRRATGFGGVVKATSTNLTLVKAALTTRTMARMREREQAFPDALRKAIRDSGLSLEGIARRLRTKGAVVSIGTLSHWQSGTTTPTRQESLRAISQLEELLGLAPDELRRLVRLPHLRGRATRESQMLPVASSYERGDRVREMLAEVDMSSDERLMRISQHDRLRIGRDRAKESLVVRQILRATHDGPDRFVIAFWQDTDDPAPEEVRALRGCSLGKTLADRTAHALVAELLFDRPLSRGETVVTEHEFLRVSPPPADDDDCYGRSFRYPIRECLIEVDFHPEALPASCQTVATPTGETDSPVRRDLPIDSTGGVHAVVAGFGPGVFQVDWAW